MLLSYLFVCLSVLMYKSDVTAVYSFIHHLSRCIATQFVITLHNVVITAIGTLCPMYIRSTFVVILCLTYYNQATDAIKMVTLSVIITTFWL